MPAILYTALRSIDLNSNRIAGSRYQFDVECQSEDQSRHVFKSVVTALDGSTETITTRREDRLLLTATVVDAASLAQLVEFLNSVESGERFAYDQVGTATAPINPVSARIEGSGYSIVRVANAYKTITFKVILQ